MAEPRDQTRAGSELPGLLVPGLVPPLSGILAFALPRESYTWFYGTRATLPSESRSTRPTGTHPGSATRIRPQQATGKTMAQAGSTIEDLQ